MTRFELAYALFDVFGVDATRLHSLPAPERSIGDVPDINVGRMLDVGQNFLNAYEAHVEALLPALLPSIVGRCGRAGNSAQCVFATLREPLAQLHRVAPNDPSSPESVRLQAVLEAEHDRGLPAMARAGLRALLLSPSFYTVTSEAPIATRLALVLWSSVPDIPLLELAEAGQLQDPQVFEQQVRRMRADPKFARFGVEFSRQWLRLDRPPQFRPSLQERRLIEDRARFTQGHQQVASWLQLNLDERRPLRALLQGETSLVRSSAVLTALSSPIKGGGDENWLGRGLVVQSAFMCRNFPLAAVYPAKAWDAHPLLDPKRSDATSRPAEPELLGIRTHDQPCAQCHMQLETIGAALAAYDGMGDLIGENAPNAEQVQRYVTLGRAGSEALHDADAVANWVLGSGRFERCVAQKLSTYVLGRAVLPARRPSDRCLVSALTSTTDGETTLDGILEGLLRGPEFQQPGNEIVRERPTPLPTSTLYRQPVVLAPVSAVQCAEFAPAQFIVDQCGTSACHGPGSATGVFAFGDEALVRRALKAGRPNPRGYCKDHPTLLDARPEQSLIRQKLLGGDVCGAPMPITGGARSMGALELSCLVHWLDGVAHDGHLTSK